MTTVQPPNNTPMPRWVKIFGAVLIALVATFAVVHLAGHGMHGHSDSDPQTP